MDHHFMYEERAASCAAAGFILNGEVKKKKKVLNTGRWWELHSLEICTWTNDLSMLIMGILASQN